METEEMEDMIFGSTPDPDDEDGCLDDAPERRVRAELAWPGYLAENPPPPELLGLLTRCEQELREMRVDPEGSDEADFLQSLIGSGLRHIAERPDAKLDELEMALVMLRDYNGEDGDELRGALRSRFDRQPGQMTLC